MAAGLAQHRRAPHDPGHQVDLGAFGDGLVNRAGDLLTQAGAVAEHERGDDTHAQLLAGDVIGVPHLRCHRRQVVCAVGGRIVAAIHHDAAERQVDEIAGLEVAPRAVIPERRDPGVDQSGKLFPQRCRPQPQRIERSFRRGLQQNVGGGHQRPKTPGVALALQIQLDRALAAVVLPEEQGSLGIHAILVERPDAPRRASPRRLHLDDVGAEACERQPAIFRQLIGQLDDPDARQRAGARPAIGGWFLVCSHGFSPIAAA